VLVVYGIRSQSNGMNTAPTRPGEGKKEGTPPLPVAILLCDQVITESNTGKKSLIGVFDRIAANSFPIVHGRAAIYIRMADAEGSYDVEIQYVKVCTQDVLNQATGRVEAHGIDRYRETDFAIPIGAIEIPEPGEYEFRVLLNGRFFQRARFTAEKLQA